MNKKFSHYRQLWEQQFPTLREVSVTEDGVLTNAYCVDCRFCCGPQAEEDPFPMPLLDSQISDSTPEDFHLLDKRTACLDRRGCKALTPSGCRLDRALRPVACNIFPIVLVNTSLYLYRICPASMFVPDQAMQRLARRVRDRLDILPVADVCRISITRRPEDLAMKYQDLHLPVYGR